ncbi:MAG TPA: hypothetical protein VM143_11425 [Acidimicrobiales bacterium]|nr:hypothetical protein [Acidimicrobiales bacterium]
MLSVIEDGASSLGLDDLVVDVVDALVVRGASWLEPAAVDLDPSRLSDLSSFEASKRRVALTPVEPPRMEDLEVAGPPGAEHHRLAWRVGRLHLVDHPDPEADLALSALGGERCPCLDVLDGWTTSQSSDRMLVVGARRLDEVLTAPDEAIAALAADLARWRGAVTMLRDDAQAARDTRTVEVLDGVVRHEERAAQDRLGALRLLAIDPRLQLRLQASVSSTIAAGGLSTALAVANAARARPSLRALGWRLATAELDELLPATWIASVWARGIADAVPGHLVVDVTDVTPVGELVVVAAGPGKAQVEMRVAPVRQ